MSGTCATCIHWKRNERSWHDTDEEIRRDYVRFPEEGERRVAKMAELDHWGECAMMRGPTWEERREGTLAVAEDGSSYKAIVLTREGFSCAMFTEAT